MIIAYDPTNGLYEIFVKKVTDALGYSPLDVFDTLTDHNPKDHYITFNSKDSSVIFNPRGINAPFSGVFLPKFAIYAGDIMVKEFNGEPFEIFNEYVVEMFADVPNFNDQVDPVEKGVMETIGFTERDFINIREQLEDIKLVIRHIKFRKDQS